MLLVKKYSIFTISHFSKKETKDFLNLLSELLSNGFDMEQSLSFLKMVTPKRKSEIKLMKKYLLKGKSLAKTLSLLNLNESQQAQLTFAEVHGDIVSTLDRMSQQMSDQEKQKNQLIKVGSYPVILLTFLFGVIVGMKTYILPQLSDLYSLSEDKNWGLVLVENSPMIILSIFLIALCVYLLGKVYFSHKTAIEKANWWSRVPVVRKFCMSYYTSLFATEWGKLLTQGMEFREVLLVMNQQGYTQLMQEMAQTIEQQLENGITINGPIQEWQFLKPELNLILLQGEVKGDLGKELLIYGRREWTYLMKLAENKISIVQPLMFVFIAVLIISVYSALLLPIYKGMGGLY